MVHEIFEAISELSEVIFGARDLKNAVKDSHEIEREKKIPSPFIPIIVFAIILTCVNFTDEIVKALLNTPVLHIALETSAAIPILGVVAQGIFLGYGCYKLYDLIKNAPKGADGATNEEIKEHSKKKLKQFVSIIFSCLIIAIAIAALANPFTGPPLFVALLVLGAAKAAVHLYQHRNEYFKKPAPALTAVVPPTVVSVHDLDNQPQHEFDEKMSASKVDALSARADHHKLSVADIGRDDEHRSLITHTIDDPVEIIPPVASESVFTAPMPHQTDPFQNAAENEIGNNEVIKDKIEQKPELTPIIKEK